MQQRRLEPRPETSGSATAGGATGCLMVQTARALIAQGGFRHILCVTADNRLSGLPPGANWDRAAGVVTFTPDLTQGGQSWDLTVWASDGEHSATATWRWVVEDTLQPPAPEVVDRRPLGTHTLWRVHQPGDPVLDPGLRATEALVTVPTVAVMGRQE